MAVVSLIILMCISVVQIPFPHVERIVMYRETRGRDAQLWVTVPCAAKGSLRVFRDFGSNNWNSNSIFWFKQLEFLDAFGHLYLMEFIYMFLDIATSLF
jgi:hypothetical protein